MMPLPELRHIRVGYMTATTGDIRIATDGHVQFHGDTVALARLWESITSQSLYRGLTAPQTLALMCAAMRGPTWATPIHAPIHATDDSKE